MANTHTTLSALFAAIANAIRGKTGGTGQIVADNFPSAISAISTGVDTSDATATASDMASGKTAYVNGVKVTGSLTDNAGTGYSSTVIQASQLVADNYFLTLPYALGNYTEGIYRQGYQFKNKTALSNLGDATAEDVAAGKTFTSTAGLKVTGTGSSSGTSITPSYGFVPTAVDSSNHISEGTWYGTTVPMYAFYNYSNTDGSYNKLTNINFNDQITEIGLNAFYNCNSLGLTSLPSSLVSIGNYAFYHCGSLALTSIPSSITYIGASAFSNCTNVAFTELPAGLTTIEANAFYSCQKLTVTELPLGLTRINASAFYSCLLLAITEIPETVTTIGSSAFYNCTKLTSITFKGTPSTINKTAFSKCSNLTTINVPWAEGAVTNAPWGATNAVINYNYTGA